ncbi:Receptor-like protein 13 [Citrus sinensis]|uniref:Receptor-like protein 13 n=1 Tax=Citrus sinensis TaxID=2711 RepID=A0ACB8KH92_CITSI|nr:Receptor-like protein 13 [Citrus sinensis]
MVIMFVLLLIKFEGGWSEGCLDHEIFALFRLKYFFNDLHDWVDDEGATDCCQWVRVECNNTTDRVIALDLSDTRNWDLGEWYLNASLFTPFQQLESLDLSWNKIAGCVENEGLERLSKLNNLKMLDLSENLFDNSILSFVGRLSSLRSLKLSYNRLEGSIDVKELDSLRDLEELDIGWNKIDKFVVSKGLRKLKYLGLSGNKLNHSILSSLTIFSLLRELYLRDTGFKGTFDVREFNSFNNLEALDMSNNEIDNLVVPQGYRGLRNLKSLDLSEVGIRDGSNLLRSMGSFPSLNTLYLTSNNFIDTTSELHNFTNLEYLALDSSSLHISLLQSIASFTSLKILTMTNCEVNGVLSGQELHNFANLEYLALDFSSLHTSLLQSIASFTSLKKLSMTNCEVNGVLSGQALETLSRLTNLKMLDLRGNLFNNSILSSLAHLSSLTSLDLSENKLEGSINVKEFDSLSNLEELDMSGNEIDNFQVPQGYGGLRKLKSLHLSRVGIRDGSKLLRSMGSFPSLNTLYLWGNNFTETMTTTTQGFPHFKSLEHLEMDDARIALNTSFLQIIGELMPSLKYLSLSYSTPGTNSIEILDQGLCSLMHMQELHIAHNDLRGSLPWCLANMTSLRILDVSSNQLTGSISSSPLIHLTSIEELRLSDNHFRIPISLEPLFNHSRLQIFDAYNNEINAEITQSPSLTPNFQLSHLSLSFGYGDGVTFPKFLYHQHDLVNVDLSHIKMNGGFPNWLLENNTRLETLSLVNDSLAGPFRLPIHSHKQLRLLDVSNNNFQGHIPVEIGDILPSLISFNISMNALNGSIPSSFGNINSLQILDLSNNQLIGEIPEHLAVGCVNLEYLTLSNNNLEGHMFTRNFNLTNLRWLQLESNHFVGEIPQSLSKCSSLEGLYLNNNSLSGKIPRWLGNLKGLKHIIMPENHLEGPIPMEFCQLYSLQLLDISDNNISGSLPSCFHLLSIEQVHLSKNMLRGQLKRGTFFNCSSLVTLDLSYNRLNGSIPNWVDGLSQLRHLILGHNNLEGEVPVQLCGLNQLQLLDLSNNNLHGHIPPCFDNTTLHESYSNSSSLKPFEISLVMESGMIYAEKQIHEIFEFTTKNIAHIYQGKVLSLLSGLDLSCNKLIGHIPPQIGNLTRIQTLNLSHNNLIGSIPSTFSNLKQIESLDLSYNKLNGKIPHQLMELNALAVFSVAYNNLSGEIPECKAQFATFNERSYEGNTFLCGLPLPICRSPATMPEASIGNERDDNLIDIDSFFITFTTSYIIVIFGIVIVLYVNSYWRHRWFYFVEMWITSCYYFVVDNLIPTRFCH